MKDILKKEAEIQESKNITDLQAKFRKQFGIHQSLYRIT